MPQYPERNGFAKTPGGWYELLPGYSGLYLSSGFRDLGMNLIGLFVPLYVLKITGSVTSIFLFYAVYHFGVIVSDYPVAFLVKWLGIDLIGFLGALVRAGFVFLLIQAEGEPFFLWLAAAVWGVTVSLTWLPFHWAFTVAEGDDGKYGKEVSRYRMVGKMAQLLGPLAGGMIVATLGFKSLFWLAMVLLVASGLPLFLDRVRGRGMRLSWEKMKGHLRRRKQAKFWLSFVGGELESVVLGLAWPLFIFLAVQNYEVLGLIKSAATLVSIVLVWFLGKWIDRKGKGILHLGTLVNAFNILLRSFLVSPFALFLVDSVYGMTSDLVITPFDSAFYEEAIKMRKLEFIVEREFVIHASGVMVCLVLAVLFLFEIGWFWIFLLAVVGVLMRNYILSPGEED